MLDSYEVRFSPRSRVDLEAIDSFIARESQENAGKMVERILSAIQTLRAAPNRTIFQRSRKLDRPVRALPVKSYVIYFHVIDEERVVQVLTIRHGARRRPRRFE